MDTQKNHIPKTRSATKGAVCRTVLKNQAAHARDARAYEDDAIDMIHHNERGKKKERVPAPKTEPEPDYESEGMIPHN